MFPNDFYLPSTVSRASSQSSHHFLPLPFPLLTRRLRWQSLRMYDFHLDIIDTLDWGVKMWMKNVIFSWTVKYPQELFLAHSNVIYFGAKGFTRSSHSGIHEDHPIRCYPIGVQPTCSCAPMGDSVLIRVSRGDYWGTLPAREFSLALIVIKSASVNHQPAI